MPWENILQKYEKLVILLIKLGKYYKETPQKSMDILDYYHIFDFLFFL